MYRHSKIYLKIRSKKKAKTKRKKKWSRWKEKDKKVAQTIANEANVKINLKKKIIEQVTRLRDVVKLSTISCWWKKKKLLKYISSFFQNFYLLAIDVELTVAIIGSRLNNE